MLTRDQQKLVTDHVAKTERMAVAIWRSQGGEKDEIVALAYMGLVEAASRYSYDPEVTSFWTFAKPRISGSIKDAGRKADHVTRSVRTRYKAGDMSVAAEVEARPVSLDADTDRVRPVKDRNSTDSQAEINVLLEAMVDEIRSMSPVHQTILAMHYFAGLELKQIAEYLKVPDSRIGGLHIEAVMQATAVLRQANRSA